MSDEMKKYNTFKFICIDNENITDKDVVTLKVENGYLVGNLLHLSNYALVAQNVEETEGTTPTGAKTNNPGTGDNIMMYVTLFAISVVGIIITRKNRK